MNNKLENKIISALSNRSLHLILFPTEQCNFRCTYCYEDFEIGQMKKWVVNATKKLLSVRVPELDQLTISWFGGEPLLAKKVIFEISSHILGLLKNHQTLKYGANMTTNAYSLDIKTAKQLFDLGVKSYQISLDGDEEKHGETRQLLNRKNSFSKIWHNLIQLRNSPLDIKVLLRIHYSIESYQQLSSLIDKINTEFSKDNRFEIYFKSIERLGGPNDHLIQPFSEAEKIKIKKQLDAKLVGSPVVDFGDDYICYASKPNSLAIRADGSIGKCTVALNDNRNKIGNINLDGSLNINQEYLRLWIKGIESLEKQELACPYSLMNKNIKIESLPKI